MIELAAHNDPVGITTGQIAAEMGVSQGAIFRHFADKQAIWAAVLDWTSTELQRRFDSLPAQPPLDSLYAMLTAHIDFLIENPGVPRILFGELQRAGETPTKAIAKQLMANYRTRIVAKLETARSQGSIAPDSDVAAQAVLFLAMVQGLVMQALAVDDFTGMPDWSKRVFALYRTGLEMQP